MIIDTRLTTFSPYECLVCGNGEQLLCNACSRALLRVPSRCYRCRQSTPRYQTCTTCRTRSNLHSVVRYTNYGKTAKELVRCLRLVGAQRAATEMARLMAGLLPENDKVVLAPIPTAAPTEQRAHDPVALLAKAIARRARQAYVPCLQRLNQLPNNFRCVRTEELTNKHVVLVDDRLVTGATLEVAARLLKVAGANRVSALVFAQA